MPLSLHKSLWGVLGVGLGSDSESPQEQHQPPDEPPPSPDINVESEEQPSKLNSRVVSTEPARVDRLESSLLKPRLHSEPASAFQTNTLLNDSEISYKNTGTSGICVPPFHIHECRHYKDESITATGKTTGYIWARLPQDDGGSSWEQVLYCIDVRPKVMNPVIQKLQANYLAIDELE